MVFKKMARLFLSLEKVLEKASLEEKELIYKEINKVYDEIKNLNIELTRKKNLI